MLDESILNADVYITSPAFAFLANYFIDEIYNLFPCNVASSKHAGKLGEYSSSVGNDSCSANFPRV